MIFGTACRRALHLFGDKAAMIFEIAVSDVKSCWFVAGMPNWTKW